MTITKADFSQLSILVVDDSQFVRRLVEEVLLGFGVGKVASADSADKAFTQIEASRPDLIICDWQMHPVDGLTILRKLRQETRHPRVPFIMLTAHNGNDDVATAIREGADSYIVKPFSAQTLMNHLLKVIAADNGHVNNEDSWAV